MRFYPIVSLLFPVALARASEDKEGSTPSRYYLRNRRSLLPIGEFVNLVLSSVQDAMSSSVNATVSTKIVGGIDVEDGRYGFFVQGQGCGGSLVAADVVLSAAHCAEAFGSSVIIGNYQFNQLTEGAESRAIVSSMYTHPDYSMFSLRNDLMLFKIEPSSLTPITINTDAIIPIDDQDLTVIGFGAQVQDGSQAFTLQKAELQYVPNEECNSLLYGRVDDTMLCAMKSDASQDSCQGDSGGPIFDEVSVTLVGAVSWGLGCALPNSPGVYARLSNNLEWLFGTICDLTDTNPDFCGEILPPSTAPPAPIQAPSPVAPVAPAPIFAPVFPAPAPSPSSSGFSDDYYVDDDQALSDDYWNDDFWDFLFGEGN